MLFRIAFAAALAALILGSQACSSSKPATEVVVVKSEPATPAPASGPPPHAPAHGYRHKHKDGVDLVYDGNRGVYEVRGHSKCYWQDGRYYRERGGRWEMSVSIRGPWGWVGVHTVPTNLTAEYTKTGRSKKH